MWSLQVSILEMDGQFDRLDELIYVESHLSNISTKFYGEVTQQMLKHADFPGSNNGTGLFQTIVGLKIRDLYEQIVASKAGAQVETAKVWETTEISHVIDRTSRFFMLYQLSVREISHRYWDILHLVFIFSWNSVEICNIEIQTLHIFQMEKNRINTFQRSLQKHQHSNYFQEKFEIIDMNMNFFVTFNQFFGNEIRQWGKDIQVNIISSVCIAVCATKSLKDA